MKKTVTLNASFPLGRHPSVKVPWEDIYLKWKSKPGRKTYYAAPCVECAAELVADLAMHEEIRNRDDDWQNPIDALPTKRTTKEERQSWYRDDDALFQRVLADLETQEYACYGEGGGLTIVTKANGIDKREAERMLAWWLEKTHGIRNPKFRWQRSDFIITPMGFGDYQE